MKWPKWDKHSYGRCALSLIVGLTTLLACRAVQSTSQPTEATLTAEEIETILPPHKTIRKSTVELLFSLAGDHIQKEDSTETIYFVCAIVEAEGEKCYFGETIQEAETDPTAQIDDEIAIAMVREELGWKVVESARELRVRCRQDVNQELPVCEYYHLSKWEPLTVKL
jgi:hypothetical protein